MALLTANTTPAEWLDGRLEQLLKARSYASTIDYNDAPERTHQEVLDLLDEAIANYEDAGADL